MVEGCTTEGTGKEACATRRTTYLSLSESLRRAAKARSALLGESMSAYVTRLLQADLLSAGMLPQEKTRPGS